MSTNEQTIDDGGLAFPFACQGSTTAPEFYYGMSLRDWFAGQAVAAIADTGLLPVGTPELVASAAYELADAMIAARKVSQ